MQQTYFNSEHELFRQSIDDFMLKHVTPNIPQWEADKRLPREIWKLMGDQGYLGLNVSPELGGSGADFFYSVIFLESLAHAASGGFAAAVSVHQYMAIAHLLRVGSDFLKEEYVRPAVSGDKIGALAITEPGGGSDVSAMKTKAEDRGDYYLLNGSKTFITNGVFCDFIATAVVTDPTAGTDGISLMIIDREASGVISTPLEKMGWHCSDTAEISFSDVKVPKSHLIGEEGRGFYYIMESFQLERLVAAITPVKGCELMIQSAVQYMRERKTFGKSLTKYQTLRHKIALLSSEVTSLKAFVYHTCQLYNEGEFAVKECSMAKMMATELAKKVADECLQIYGGYGYMKDFPIERVYRDARVGTIVGGTTEIMLEIISKMVIDEVEYKPVYEEESSANKPTTAKEIIYSLEERLRPEKVEGYHCNFHFDIAGKNGGQFTVSIGDGKCSVQDGLHGSADCTVKVKDSNYEKLELGQLNPQMAVMMGKIKMSNLNAMMEFTKKFKRLF